MISPRTIRVKYVKLWKIARKKVTQLASNKEIQTDFIKIQQKTTSVSEWFFKMTHPTGPVSFHLVLVELIFKKEIGPMDSRGF